MPEPLGDIALYAGDPKTIVLWIEGIDLSAYSFTSQLRRRRSDTAVVREFTVTQKTQPNIANPNVMDTLITLALAGDSAPGAQDGATRLPAGMRSAYFDVQMWDHGRASGTPVDGRLVQNQDVTR